MKKTNRYIFARILIIIAVQMFLILYKGLDSESLMVTTLINLSALMSFAFIIGTVSSKFESFGFNTLLFIFDSLYILLIVLVTMKPLSPFIALLPVYIYFTSISIKKYGVLLSTVFSILVIFASVEIINYSILISSLVIMFAIAAGKRKEVLAHTDTNNLKLVNTITSVMAHEIKNPVSSIAGVWELIKSDGTVLDSPDSRKKLLGIIERESLRLTNLVEEFLTYSAPEKRRKEDINLNDLVHQTCDSVMANIDFINKGLSLKYTCEDKEIKMTGDYQRIEQAISNILINSVYASPQKGKITCALSLKHGEAVIKITNNGEKIPKQNLDKIFQPFFTTKEKGTGLGLAIAKNIITAHDGRIDVMSGDKETIFRIGVRV